MEPSTRRSFRIGPCVGRGGFGEVYRATLRTPGGLETEVALKVLRPEAARSSDAARRFRDEARLLARLQHPAVVRILDWADLGGGQLALVTEFVDGADLGERVAAGLPPRPLLEALAGVASALAAAWEAPGPDGRPLRIVHRDLKPSNVRVGRHGQVRLLDFGIASFSSPDREVSTSGDLLVGSLPYLPPERFAERLTSPAGDVYALGCTWFEGLAREPFHQASGLRELTSLALDPARAAEHRARRLASLAEAPPEVVDLLGSCLEHDPERRPAASLLAIRLESLAARIPGPTLRRWCEENPAPPAEPLQGPWSGRTVTEGEGEEPVGAVGEGKPRVAWSAPETTDSQRAPEGRPAVAEPPPEPGPAPASRRAAATAMAAAGLGCAILGASILGAGLLGAAAALLAEW